MVLEQTQTLSREELFIRLYKSSFPQAAGLVKKYGGDFEDAKDIFQDALVIYFEKHVKDDFSPQVNEEVYLFGIVRHLWYKRHHEKNREQVSGKEPENFSSFGEEPVVSERLAKFVERSGKKCLELLTAFYYDKLSMKEVASRFGFSGERSATAQKYKCLEKVRDSIRSRALNKEDFYE